MLLSTFFLSLLNLCVKELKHLPTAEIVLFRAVQSLIITSVWLKVHKIHPWGNNKRFLLIRGISGLIAVSTFFYTIQKMPLASAVAIQYLNPIFTLLLAGLFNKEKITGWQWVVISMSFVGAALVQGYDGRVETTDLLIGIFSAMCSGFAYNSVRKLRDSEHPLVVVLYFPLIATPFALAATIPVWQTPVGIEWLYVLGIGIFTQLGQVYLTKAVMAEPLSKVAPLNYMAIVYAFVIGLTFFGETFEFQSTTGILMILSGIGLNLYENKRQDRKAINLPVE